MPHPFSFLLPQLASKEAPEEKRGSSKAESHNSQENPILFSSFTKHFEKIENTEIKQFLTAIERLDEEPAPYNTVEVYKRFNQLFSNSENVEIVLKAILDARANVLGKLPKKLKNQKIEVEYLLESEKRRRFMGRVILCLKDNLFKNHNEYTYDFIKQFSEDLKINTYNMGMGFYFEYFSTENALKLMPYLEKETLCFYVYSALEHWLQEDNSVDDTSLASLMSYPSLVLQYKAALGLSTGQIKGASECFLESEKLIHNRGRLFLTLKEKGWQEAESIYQFCIDKEKEGRTSLENDYGGNSLRQTCIDMLRATEIFSSPMLDKNLPLPRDLEAKLATYCYTTLPAIEKLNVENFRNLECGINLLYMMMANAFNGQLSNVLICENIAKNLKTILLKTNDKSLVLLKARNNLDDYLQYLENRKTAVSNLAQDRAAELKTMQAQEAVQAALEGKKAKKVVKEKSSDKEKELSTRIMQLTKDLDAALKDNVTLKGQMKSKEDKHKQKAKEFKRQIETLGKEVEELTEKCKTFSKIIQQLESSTSQSKIDELSISLQQQESENVQLRKNNEDLGKEVERLNRTLKNQTKRKNKISDLRAQLDIIKIERDAKAEEIARNKSSTEESQAQLAALQTQQETLTKNLEDQLAKKKLESDANKAAYHKSVQANTALAKANAKLATDKAHSDQNCHLLAYQLGAVTETAAVMQEQALFYSSVVNQLEYTLDSTLAESMKVVKLHLPYLCFKANPSIVLAKHPEHIQYYLVTSLQYKKDFSKEYTATIKQAMREFGGRNSQNYYSLIHLISGSYKPLNAFQCLEKQQLIGSLILPQKWPNKWKSCFNPDWRKFVELELGKWQRSKRMPLNSHFPFVALMLLAPYYHEKSKQQDLSVKKFVDEFLTAFQFTPEEKTLLKGQLTMHLGPNVEAFEQYLECSKKEADVTSPKPAPILIHVPKKTELSNLPGSDKEPSNDPSSDKKTPDF